jgi:hypothetical protein
LPAFTVAAIVQITTYSRSDGAMSNGPQLANAGDRNGTATDRAQEIYDQLLAVGKEVAAAYVQAYQKTAAGIAEYQDKVAKAGWSSGLRAGPNGQHARNAAGTEARESLRTARAQALEMSEKLQEMNKRITLAYLNACELAALAVADCQEELAATSKLDFVKMVGSARVEFNREMTKACVSAAREIVGEGPDKTPAGQAADR